MIANAGELTAESSADLARTEVLGAQIAAGARSSAVLWRSACVRL